MIDKSTGEVTLGEVAVSPSLDRVGFQNSELFEKATPMMINEPWASYRVGFEQGGMVLQFKEGKLLSINIGFNLPDESQQGGWESWSQKNERKRKHLHDQILKEEIGSISRTFSWGEVGSISDPKTCDASIFVQYV